MTEIQKMGTGSDAKWNGEGGWRSVWRRVERREACGERLRRGEVKSGERAVGGDVSRAYGDIGI